MIVVLLVGTVSWVIIGGSALPFVAVFELVASSMTTTGDIKLWSPIGAVNGWLATCFIDAESGLAWSVVLYLIVQSQASLLETRNRRTLRLIGTVLGGVAGVIGVAAQPHAALPTLREGIWLLIQGSTFGYL